MVSLINSSQNKIVKELTRLSIKKYRDKQKSFIVEGERFVAEIPLDWKINQIILSESFALNKDIQSFKTKAPTFILADNIFKLCSDTVSPQGIMAVCQQKQYELEYLSNVDNPFILIGECITDPGNLGTLIRTADSAGCDGVILSKGSADIYNPKTVRSTAGSLFHLPIIINEDLNHVIPLLKSQNISTVAGHLKGRSLYDLDFKGGCAILVGNEANGISEETAMQVDCLTKIPIRGKAESLNASIATAILLYEVVRQRTMSYNSAYSKY